MEEPLCNNLVRFAHEVIELEEEPVDDMNVIPLANEKEVAVVKNKCKNTKVATHASIQLNICSLTKVAVQRTAAHATTIVKNPSVAIFGRPYVNSYALGFYLIAILS